MMTNANKTLNKTSNDMQDRTGGASEAQKDARSATTSSPSLIPAKELTDFTLPASAKDVRGWEALTADGHTVGTVDTLMVDPKAKHIRYLAVKLSADLLPQGTASDERRVLIPIGLTRRVDGERKVAIDKLTRTQLGQAPRYDAARVTRADERASLDAFGLDSGGQLSADAFYSGPRFDEKRLFGTPTAVVS